MTVTDTEISGHQQVGTFSRDDRWFMRCSCGWVSVGCLTTRKAAGRWNVHRAVAVLEDAKGRA